MDIPCEWRNQDNDYSTYANLRWWEQFGDPVLNDYIKEALRNNRDLKVATSRILEYFGNLEIALSNLFPLVTANASGTRNQLPLYSNFIVPGSPSFPRTYNQYSLIFNFSYEVDFWGRVRSLVEAGYAQYFASIEAQRMTIMTLVTSVASNYFILRQYDRQLKISRETLHSRILSYDLAVYRFKEGLTSELEVKQADSEVQTAAAEVIELELSISQQENLISVLLGRNPQDLIRGPLLPDLCLPSFVPEGFPSDLLDQRPDIREAEQKLIAANAQIGVARAQFFPQVTLAGYYGNQSFQLGKLFTNPAVTWQYGVNIAQNIFTGGNITGQVDVAIGQKLELLYQYEQTVLNAFREVNDAIIAHQKALEYVKVLNKQVQVLKDALELANLKYNNGQTDYLNVLDAERNLFAAQLNNAAAQANTFITVVSLYRALGGGWILDAECMETPHLLSSYPIEGYEMPTYLDGCE